MSKSIAIKKASHLLIKERQLKNNNFELYLEPLSALLFTTAKFSNTKLGWIGEDGVDAAEEMSLRVEEIAGLEEEEPIGDAGKLYGCVTNTSF
jgi:hypothetical protein